MALDMRGRGRFLVYDEVARTDVACGFENREDARAEKRRLDPAGTQRLVISRDVLHRLGRSRGR